MVMEVIDTAPPSETPALKKSSPELMPAVPWAMTLEPSSRELVQIRK